MRSLSPASAMRDAAIALRQSATDRPVIGMFLGGAGLADTNDSHLIGHLGAGQYMGTQQVDVIAQLKSHAGCSSSTTQRD